MPDSIPTSYFVTVAVDSLRPLSLDAVRRLTALVISAGEELAMDDEDGWESSETAEQLNEMSFEVVTVVPRTDMDRRQIETLEQS